MARISTTLGAGAIVQARLANVASFSVTLADTGVLNAEAQDESQGNVVLVLPAPVTARYLRVDFTDGAAPYMDIGLLVAGQLWRLLRGTAYGIREGPRDARPTRPQSLHRGRIPRPGHYEPAYGGLYPAGTLHRRGTQPTPRDAPPPWRGSGYAVVSGAWG